MFVRRVEFLMLLWRSLYAGLIRKVNLIPTMPMYIGPDVNSLTLSISVSLWAGTTLPDIIKRLAFDTASKRKAAMRHARSSVWSRNQWAISAIKVRNQIYKSTSYESCQNANTIYKWKSYPSCQYPNTIYESRSYESYQYLKYNTEINKLWELSRSEKRFQNLTSFESS